MIRIRRTLERGRAHPILGPLVLILLVLLLVMVFLHAVGDDHQAGLGAVCLGLVTFLGIALSQRVRRRLETPLLMIRGDRGPPLCPVARVIEPALQAIPPRSLPLRR